MSHIPNSAMPHAAPKSDTQQKKPAKEKQQGSMSKASDRVKTAVRDNPKTAIAAGAAVVAGAIAAAAIPLVRGSGSDKAAPKKKTATAKSKKS